MLVPEDERKLTAAPRQINFGSVASSLGLNTRQARSQFGKLVKRLVKAAEVAPSSSSSSASGSGPAKGLRTRVAAKSKPAGAVTKSPRTPRKAAATKAKSGAAKEDATEAVMTDADEESVARQTGEGTAQDDNGGAGAADGEAMDVAAASDGGHADAGAAVAATPSPDPVVAAAALTQSHESSGGADTGDSAEGVEQRGGDDEASMTPGPSVV